MKVSVVTPTRDRPLLLQQAIRCFQSQTYQDIEMVILDNSQHGEFTPPNDPRIRYIRQAGPVITTGAMRNLAISYATGEVICNFDDDDWSAPNRIEKQVSQLLSSGKQMVGYNNIYFWSLPKQQAFLYTYKNTRRTHYASGAGQMFYRSWWEQHRYEEKQIGSDTTFSYEADDAGVLESFDSTGMLVAGHHGGNTSKWTLGSVSFPEIDINRLPALFLEQQLENVSR